MNGNSTSSSAGLKALMRVSALLSSGSKTSGQPPAVHPPWNKARVRPVEGSEGSGDRVEQRKGEVTGRGLESGDAAKRDNKPGERDEAKERGRERGGGGEMETLGRSSRSSMMINGMRNAVDGGGATRPEHRGGLPGLWSCGHAASFDGGIVINGSYFQTSVEASKPAPVKQKLSEALSLISLTRRLQGPARVGDKQRSNGKSWERGEENSGKTNDSIGGTSISASVSEGAMGEQRRRWERQSGEENSDSEEWWRREKRFHNSDSEAASGSKESPSEFSASTASSPTSSLTAEHDKTGSDPETEENESDSGTEKEEGTLQTESDSGGQRESGAEGEDEWKGSGRDSSTGVSGIRSKSRSSSAKLKREKSSRSSNSSKTGRNSSDASHLRHSGSTSRPQTSRHSSHETVEEESKEEEESEEGEEEAKRAAPRKSSRRADSCVQSDVGSGAMGVTDDLSPIIEDTEEEEEEEEEERSSSLGEEDEDKEEEDLENDSAA